MSDLLKEAIADAKAVRETALQNAKMALEEAFTPHLKSMLSAKLAEEDEDEDENPFAEKEEDDEEKEKEKFETNEEVEVEVEGIGKYHDDENNNESDDWADDNTSYWWREEQKSWGEVRILERRKRREVESNFVGSDPKEERKHLESLITRIRALRMRAESIGRQVA